jgi:ribosomal protein S27AE
MPVPRGYREIDMGPMTIKVLTCLRCGALVLMYRTHNSWHTRNGD